MPIYDYRCPECGELFELLVRGSMGEQLRCPSCQGERIEKLPSAGRLVHSRASGGSTCCGREERCDRPPCSGEGSCCHG